MSAVTVIGHGFPPLFTIQVHEDGEGQTLTMDFERYVTNGEVTAFLNAFSENRFVVKECDITNHPKHKAANGKLLVGIRLTFYPNITQVEEIPGFVREFSGLVEGKMPKPPKRLTVWERLREPLV